MNVPVGAAGVRGLGGRGYLAFPSLGRGYHLKGDKRGEEKLYDLLPGMELTPMNHGTLKPQGIKLAPQVRAPKRGVHIPSFFRNRNPRDRAAEEDSKKNTLK